MKHLSSSDDLLFEDTNEEFAEDDTMNLPRRYASSSSLVSGKFSSESFFCPKQSSTSFIKRTLSDSVMFSLRYDIKKSKYHLKINVSII